MEPSSPAPVTFESFGLRAEVLNPLKGVGVRGADPDSARDDSGTASGP